MKKAILAVIACMAMSFAHAQNDAKKDDRQGRKFDKTEMIKKRTDETAKKYGLNAEQSAKLLTLNTKYADMMGPGNRGMRRGRPGNPPRDGQGDKPEDVKKEKDGKEKGKRPEMTEEMKTQMAAQRKERAEQMKKYDEELQKIMTDEQFKSYKSDMQRHNRMREEGFRGPRRN